MPLLSLMLPEGSFPTATGLLVRAGAVFGPDLGRVHLDNAAATAAAINRLRGRFAVGRGDSFATGLDLAIQDYLSASRSRSVSVQLVTAQAVAVAVYFVAVAAAIVLAGQRQVFAVWRGRGWSRAAIWALLMAEHLALRLAATLAGAAAGWAAASVVAADALRAAVPSPLAVAGQLEAPLAATVAAVAAVLAVQSWRAASALRDRVRMVLEPDHIRILPSGEE